MFFKKLPQIVFVGIFLSLSMFLPNIAYADGISWLETQTNVDGSYANDLDVSFPTQSTAEVLRVYNALDESGQLGVIAANNFLDAQGDEKTEILSRKIISAVEAGGDTSVLVDKLVKFQNYDGGFGDQEGYNSRVIDTAFALNALGVAKSNNTDTVSRSIAFIIAEQSSDGGFSHSTVNNSSIYETALVSIALQNYRFNYNLSATITGASEFILNNQDTDGSWGSVWETSYAILALVPVTVDKDQYQAGLDNLIVSQLANSSWGDDVYSTALALRALYKAENVQNPQDPTEGIFTGQVIDNTNGQPIPGVEVSVTNLTDVVTTTLADGTFVLSGIPVGEHSILYNASGFSSASQNASTVAGQFTSLGTVQLTPLSNKGVLFGVVRDSETNQVLDAATINITGDTNTTVTTDVNGYFSVELDPGVIDIAISASGYDSVSANVDVSIGQRLNFSPLLNLTGTSPTITTVTTKVEVVDAATNQPIPNVLVSVVGTAISGLTDASGKLVLENIESGSLTIELSVTDYQSVTANTLASAGSTIDLGVVRLSKSDATDKRTVKGFVTDAVTGVPIPNAIIAVEGTAISVASGTDGFYIIDDTGLASFSLVANADGYLQNGGQINLDQPGLATVNIELAESLVEGINIESVRTDASQYFAYKTAKISTIIKNTGNTSQRVQVFAEITNSNNEVVYRVALNPADVKGSGGSGNIVVPAYEVEAGGTKELIGLWFTGVNLAGEYTVRIDVLSESSGQLLTQKSLNITVAETNKINISIKPSPVYTSFEAERLVELSAKINNLSNTPVQTRYAYSFIDPDGITVREGEFSVDMLPDEQLKTTVLDSFHYIFDKTGVYTLVLDYLEGLVATRIQSDSITVAPTIRIEASESINPETVVPDGDKRIRINIEIKGVQQQ